MGGLHPVSCVIGIMTRESKEQRATKATWTTISRVTDITMERQRSVKGAESNSHHRERGQAADPIHRRANPEQHTEAAILSLCSL